MVGRDVQNAIDHVIRERLAGKRILEVRAVEEEDFSGEAILSITVVIDDDIRDYDPKKLSGLVRHLRPTLTEFAVTGFPLISFATTTEAEEVAA